MHGPMVAAAVKSVTIAAWIIATIAFVAYAFLLLVALVRIASQYGSAMQGKLGLRVAAVMSEAGRRWYLFLIGAAALAIAVFAH